MLYGVGLIAVLLAWLMDSMGLTQDRMPRIMFAGRNIGFYVIHVALFALVWFVLWLLRETGFMSRTRLDGIASRQGSSRFIDMLLLVSSIVLGIAAAWAGTLSPHFQLTLLLCIVASGTSLATGRERHLRVAQLTPSLDDAVLDSTSAQALPGDTP